MTQLFVNMRMYGYVAIMVLSATVLGIDAYLGSVFLPDFQRDFTIFTIVVPSLTLLAFLAMFSWSRPYIDATVLFVLGVLWLATAAWDTDIIGNTQCDSLGGQRMRTKDGTISSQSYCYQMRVIQAFSWMLFCLFVIFEWILVTLTTRAQAMGRNYAWQEPIFELPWFGQYPGWPGSPYSGGGYAYPAAAPYTNVQYPMNGYGNVVQQQPGHSVIIRPGHGVTQVPGMVTSA